jgi:hypothetical protein
MTIAIQLIEDFMDLKQLESFVRVAELGSFTRAAGIQQVAQPLLSRHVRQLEVELHQSLLARNGRGVTLTERNSRRCAVRCPGACRLACRPASPS